MTEEVTTDQKLSNSMILTAGTRFQLRFQIVFNNNGRLKLNFFPSLVKHKAIKAYDKMDYVHLFFASVLHGCQLSASCPGRFTTKAVEPVKRWEGPRAYLGAAESRQTSGPSRVPNL
jgi:hypothetical protein